MTSDTKFKTLKEFYPFYLSEHRNPVCRKLHFSGTALLFVILIMALATGKYIWLISIPFVGYGFAWVGHFFFEKNKPATFQYPLFSLVSDFKLFFDLLVGKEKFNSEA
ncbi:DUF962 domain-containing protein [Algoriphagus mannitolivorans]|uniref:DUF962 domain-containing protein n=1 Tax=Algoriphagus mannitolivorans TaxID=226504 RepID=UPI000417BC90|nr:DUF962 domain-containing protein [Algoriphagus mannitolivorans]